MSEPNAKARILVVDDDRIILDSIGEFLRLEGFDVVSAASFPEAVGAMRCTRSTRTSTWLPNTGRTLLATASLVILSARSLHTTSTVTVKSSCFVMWN